MHSQIAAAREWLLLLVLSRHIHIRKYDRLGEGPAVEVSPEEVPRRLSAVPAWPEDVGEGRTKAPGWWGCPQAGLQGESQQSPGRPLRRAD